MPRNPSGLIAIKFPTAAMLISYWTYASHMLVQQIRRLGGRQAIIRHLYPESALRDIRTLKMKCVLVTGLCSAFPTTFTSLYTSFSSTHCRSLVFFVMASDTNLDSLISVVADLDKLSFSPTF